VKYHIIGPGVIGAATGEGFRRFGNEVVYTDKGDRHSEVEADAHFVCTPEAVASDVVRELAKPGSPSSQGLIVIRSSVPPGTTEQLAGELNRDIVHYPEFLRASVAEFEFLDSDYAVIGNTTPYHNLPLRRFVDLLQAMGKTVHLRTSTESEVLKLITNSYLATNISFWNEMKGITDALGVNSQSVARLAILDKRVSRYGAVQHGAAYGGACLPKDLAQMLDLGNRLGVQAPLLRAVQKVNQVLGGE